MGDRNHVVPQSYLKRFASGDQLCAVERAGRRYPVSIKNIAVENSFYDLHVPRSGLATDVEQFLSTDVDGPANREIEELVVHGPTEVDMEPVRRFVAFQMIRTQKFRDFMVAVDRQIKPAALAQAAVVSANRKGEIDESVDLVELATSIYAKIRESDFGAPDQNSLMRSMLRAADQLLEKLVDLSWQMVVAERPVFFTSDNPVSLLDPLGRKPPGFQGWAPRPGDELRLPLSPRHVLVGSHQVLGETVIPSCASFEGSVVQDLLMNFHRVVLLPPAMADRVLTLPVASEALTPRVTFGPSDGGRNDTTFPTVLDPEIRRLIDLVPMPPDDFDF